MIPTIMRFEEEHLTVMNSFAEQLQMNRSKCLRYMIEYLALDSEFKNLIEQYMKDRLIENRFRDQMNKIKTQNYYFHQIKNIYKVFFSHVNMMLHNIGDVDMKIIKDLLKSYKEAFELMPEKYQKLLKKHYKALYKLGNDKQLLISKINFNKTHEELFDNQEMNAHQIYRKMLNDSTVKNESN